MAINAVVILSAHPLIKFVEKVGFGGCMAVYENPAKANIVEPW
ncbi:MAG: hypothetical protein NXI17_17265 [Alphaproteobacteria bacterium]|nr:hypothetical protein [Alphaproteobacteria bacterium]